MLDLLLLKVRILLAGPASRGNFIAIFVPRWNGGFGAVARAKGAAQRRGMTAKTPASRLKRGGKALFYAALAAMMLEAAPALPARDAAPAAAPPAAPAPRRRAPPAPPPPRRSGRPDRGATPRGAGADRAAAGSGSGPSPGFPA